MKTAGIQVSGTRRERERARHREEILIAAEKVLSTRGYEGATIAEIAKEADFSVGSIYNFFKTKAELGEEVLVRISESRIDKLRTEVLPFGENPRDGLHRFVQSWTNYHFDHGAFLRMSFELQLRRGHREPPERIKRLIREYHATAASFFKTGVDAGAFRDLPPADLASAFDGLCRNFMFEWSRERDKSKPIDEEALVGRIFHIVSTLLFSDKQAIASGKKS